jgi:hypothetical protein
MNDLAIASAHLPLREVELLGEMDTMFPDNRKFTRVTDAVLAFNQGMDNKAP